MRSWLSTLLAATMVTAAAQAESLRSTEPYRLAAEDWPCEQPYREALPLGLGWSRPDLLEGLADWRQQPRAASAGREGDCLRQRHAALARGHQ